MKEIKDIAVALALATLLTVLLYGAGVLHSIL